MRLPGIPGVRWAHLLVGLAVAAPMLRPGPPPRLRPAPATRDFYETLETLPPGSRLLVAADFDPGSRAELEPMLLAVLEQAFRRGVRVVAVELWGAGPPLAQRALERVARGHGGVYGVDYANLGFVEGGEAAMAAFGTQGFAALCPVDYFGTPAGRLPVMDGVRDYGSFAAVVSLSAGHPGVQEWVQQVGTRFRVRLGAGTTAANTVDAAVYHGSGQLFGLLGGVAGAAEYEQLVGRPGSATRAMRSVAPAQAVVALLLLAGAAAGWVSPGRAGGRA